MSTELTLLNAITNDEEQINKIWFYLKMFTENKQDFYQHILTNSVNIINRNEVLADYKHPEIIERTMLKWCPDSAELLNTMHNGLLTGECDKLSYNALLGSIVKTFSEVLCEATQLEKIDEVVAIMNKIID